MGTLDGTVDHPINRPLASLDGNSDISIFDSFITEIPFLEVQTRTEQTYRDVITFTTPTTFATAQTLNQERTFTRKTTFN